MTQEEKITNGLDKELMQLIDAEMNDPVLGKLLNRNAAYVLGKEIKSVLIERACEWIDSALYLDYERSIEHRYATLEELLNDFKKAMQL